MGGGHYGEGCGPHSRPLLSRPVLAQVCLLPPEDDGASLEKEARRWATRVARDRKNKAHSEEVGAVLPHGARRGSRKGFPCPSPAPTTPLTCGCPPRCCSGWRPGGSRSRRQRRPPWSGRWKKRGKTSGRWRWVSQAGGSGRLRGLSPPGWGMQEWGGVVAGDAALRMLWHCGNHAGDQARQGSLGRPPTP